MCTGCVVDLVYTGHIAVPSHEIAEGAAAFNALFTNRRFKPEWLRPLTYLKKADIYESIPEELAKMAWSCRRPLYHGDTYSPCGECHACKTMETMHRQRALNHA